jgi:hypothetical protein
MESTNDALTFIALLISFFTALVLVVYFLAKYSYLTKKALAESGHPIDFGKGNRYVYQDIACIVIGLGLGLGVSAIISEFDLSEDTMDLLIYGTISLFTGTGLLVAHFLRKSNNR